MKGLVGALRMSGVTPRMALMLRLAERCGVGAHTTFGMGRCAIEWEG